MSKKWNYQKLPDILLIGHFLPQHEVIRIELTFHSSLLIICITRWDLSSKFRVRLIRSRFQGRHIQLIRSHQVQLILFYLIRCILFRLQLIRFHVQLNLSAKSERSIRTYNEWKCSRRKRRHRYEAKFRRICIKFVSDISAIDSHR